MLDAQDQCVLAAEDVNGYEDASGRPDPESDQDGLLDQQDKCPNEAEDKDDLQERRLRS